MLVFYIFFFKPTLLSALPSLVWACEAHWYPLPEYGAYLRLASRHFLFGNNAMLPVEDAH